jgi:two-component system OmpR family response regulator
MRILIVDDDAGVGEALGTLFGQSGHSVRWAADATTALDLARAEAPDVVLLDLFLAEGLSLGLVPQLSPARIYVITATRPSKVLREQASRAGALALLSKSIGPAELLHAVGC